MLIHMCRISENDWIWESFSLYARALSLPPCMIQSAYCSSRFYILLFLLDACVTISLSLRVAPKILHHGPPRLNTHRHLLDRTQDANSKILHAHLQCRIIC